LRAALDGYRRAGDMLDVARMRRDLGEMLVHVGRYREADRQLRRAASDFRRLDDEVGGASVERIRARIRMNAGFTRRALQRLNIVVTTLERHDQPRILARALLDRARALAQRGDGPAAARDLVAAERILGSSSSAVDRLRARLARADCLIRLGEPLRAAHGLKRVLVGVVDLEEIPARAWAHELLGQALADADPSSSRRYLMRARHLYASIDYEAAVAECEIYLAQAEHRIGLNGRGRLDALRKRSFADWPRLAAEMNIVRAEIESTRRPEQARRSLLKTRAFAIESGDGALLREADAALCAGDLADEAQVEQLTPILDTDTDTDTELTATIRESDDLVPIARPEPRVIHEAHGRITGRPRPAARFLERDNPSGGRIVLRPPRAAGVPV
jgi:hypothetical protein